MKGKDSGEAKGYAFVTFRNKELASQAIVELNNCELKVIHAAFGFSFFLSDTFCHCTPIQLNAAFQLLSLVVVPFL